MTVSLGSSGWRLGLGCSGHRTHVAHAALLLLCARNLRASGRSRRSAHPWAAAPQPVRNQRGASASSACLTSVCVCVLRASACELAPLSSPAGKPSRASGTRNAHSCTSCICATGATAARAHQRVKLGLSAHEGRKREHASACAADRLSGAAAVHSGSRRTHLGDRWQPNGRGQTRRAQRSWPSGAPCCSRTGAAQGNPCYATVVNGRCAGTEQCLSRRQSAIL